MASSLSGEGSYFNVGSFYFGSPVSASAVSKPIFEIKVTEDKINISTPMLSRSVKNILSLVSMAASALPKKAVVWSLLIPEQADQYF